MAHMADFSGWNPEHAPNLTTFWKFFHRVTVSHSASPSTLEQGSGWASFFFFFSNMVVLANVDDRKP